MKAIAASMLPMLNIAIMLPMLNIEIWNFYGSSASSKFPTSQGRKIGSTSFLCAPVDLGGHHSQSNNKFDMLIKKVLRAKQPPIPQLALNAIILDLIGYMLIIHNYEVPLQLHSKINQQRPTTNICIIISHESSHLIDNNLDHYFDP